jgi:pterin-4a-carbinolamine dehydratase
MALRKVELGPARVTRMAIGGNPFSGFSHQSAARDAEMMDYYTVARIKEALAAAEAAGVNTVFARADNHVMRTLREYWNEGGRIQWVAQTASEREDFVRNIKRAADCGAVGVYLHGGQCDYFYHNQQLEHFHTALKAMRDCGVAAGMAGHHPEIHAWIRDNLDVDFQMCCYYNPTFRKTSPHHDSEMEEVFEPADRDRMTALIPTIPRPVVHYKVLAGGRHDPAAAFARMATCFRAGDVVCVGVFLKDDPEMIAKDVKLITDALATAEAPTA